METPEAFESTGTEEVEKIFADCLTTLLERSGDLQNGHWVKLVFSTTLSRLSSVQLWHQCFEPRQYIFYITKIWGLSVKKTTTREPRFYIIHQISSWRVDTSTVYTIIEPKAKRAIRASIRWPPVPTTSFPIHDIHISGDCSFVGRKTTLDKLNRLLVEPYSRSYPIPCAVCTSEI